jgi:hypothetical protein
MTTHKPNQAQTPFDMLPKGLAETDLDDAEYRLHSFLISKQQGDGWAPYTQAFIADRLGWSPSKLKRTSEKLQARGLIAISGSGNETRAYDVLWDPPRGKDPPVRLDPAVPTARGRQGRQTSRLALLSSQQRQIPLQRDDTDDPSGATQVSQEQRHSDAEGKTTFSSLSGKGLRKGLREDLGQEEEGKQQDESHAPTESQVTQIRNLSKMLGMNGDRLRNLVQNICDRRVESAEELTRDEAGDVVATLTALMGQERSDRMKRRPSSWFLGENEEDDPDAA